MYPTHPPRFRLSGFLWRLLVVTAGAIAMSSGSLSAQTLHVPSGTYSAEMFAGLIERVEAGFADRIVGSGEVVIECSGSAGRAFNPPHLSTTLAAPARRGDSVVVVASAANVRMGDHIRLKSDTLVETGWSYGQASLSRVNAVRGRTIVLQDTLHFDYVADGEMSVHFYRPRSLLIEGVDFDLTGWKDTVARAAIRIEGFAVEFVDVGGRGTPDRRLDLLQVVYAPTVAIRKFRSTDLRYGAMLATCRNVDARGIHAVNVRHAIAPTSWTSRVHVRGLVGTDTYLDAHPSFDVTYDSVRILRGGDLGLRGFGITLRDAVIHQRPKTSRTYLGPVSLNDRGRQLAGDYAIVFDNVTIVGSVGDSPGYNILAVYPCGRLEVRRSTLPSIATVTPMPSVVIRDSRLGRFYAYAMGFDIRRTSFEAALQGRGNDPLPPLRGSWSGSARIERCTFTGYDSTALIAYASSPDTRYDFVDCAFGSFDALFAETYRPVEAYRGLTFSGCVPLEMPGTIRSNLLTNSLEVIR